MTEVSMTRQLSPFSLTQREKRRERVWYSVIVALLMALLVSIIVALSLYQTIIDPAITRSDDEMISGGKRFIDYYYSLNAATVGREQFRAVKMMMQEEDRNKRMEELIKNDFVRIVEDSRMKTEINWLEAENEIVERLDGGILDIEYKAYLMRNNYPAGQLDILLRLVPIEKSDENTDGVGVWAWKDIAENPFETVEK